nr:hypothetical protein CFP56_31991 [Quercus suber]
MYLAALTVNLRVLKVAALLFFYLFCLGLDMLTIEGGGLSMNTSALEVGGALCRIGSLIGRALLGNAYSLAFPVISWFIRLLSYLLHRPAKRSSFDKRLHKWKTIGLPHILPIDWIYKWLKASLVRSDFLIVMNILFSIFPIEKYAGNGMGTWYTGYVPLPSYSCT